MKRYLRSFVMAAASLSVGLSNAPMAAELGTTFTLNADLTTERTEYNWQVGSAGNSDLVALFTATANNNSYSFVQRFDGLGNRLQSTDWLVEQNYVHSVGANNLGDYAVAWLVPDGNNRAVYAKVYNRSGGSKVLPFKVNTSSEPSLSYPYVAVNGVGDIVVFWSVNNNLPGTGHRLLARVFSASGAPVTGEIEVAARSTAIIGPQGVAVDRNGNFTCIWLSAGPGSDVISRRFYRNGTAMTNAAIVNTYQPGGQAGMHIAMNGAGQHVIAWESWAQDGDGYGIYAQRFNASGAKVGTEIHVSENTAGDQKDSSVGIAEDGSFAIAWIDDNRVNQPATPPSVLVRQYNSSGVPLRSADVVSAPATRGQASYTSLGMEPGGTFLVAWRDLAATTNWTDLYGRRYSMDTMPVAQTLSSGVAATGLSGATGSMRYFKLNVPTGATKLTVSLSGGTAGDADFYVRLGTPPGSTGADFSSAQSGNTESIQITGIPAGVWYVAVYGYAAYSGVSLTMTAQ